MTQFFKFMQVYEDEEDQAVIPAKESNRVLFFSYTRDTKKTK